MYGSKISEADLRGKGKLGELNLVRNPLFYKKSGAEIADYLTWQYALLTSGKIPNESRLEVVYANISFDTGESLDINKILNDTRAYTAISEAKFIYEVRKLSKYKELIKSGFKIDGDKQKTIPATDEDIKEILTKVKSAEQSKKLITYLINLYRVIDLGLLKKLLADPIGEKIKTNRNTTSTTYEEDLKFDLIINTAIKKYSFEQLKTLCTKLIEIAKI
jgi:predicted transcriptional regulator